MKKNMLFKVLAVSTIAISLFTTGAFAGSNVQEIKAYMNHGISFKVNGKTVVPKDENGKVLSPIVYQGYTYVPVRFLSEALGSTVKWNDATQMISIDAQKTSGDQSGDQTYDENEGVPNLSNVDSKEFDKMANKVYRTTLSKADLTDNDKLSDFVFQVLSDYYNTSPTNHQVDFPQLYTANELKTAKDHHAGYQAGSGLFQLLYQYDANVSQVYESLGIISYDITGKAVQSYDNGKTFKDVSVEGSLELKLQDDGTVKADYVLIYTNL